MQDFNPNTRLEQNADKFEIPVSKLAGLFRSLTSILSTDVKIRGLDLSHWQADEKIDFPVLKANGIDFVILKVTEGINFIDDTFKTKYIAALAAGLIVLPYHFFRGNYGGADQAKHCVDTLRELGFLDAIDYVPIIWMDVESTDGVSISTRRNRLLASLQIIEEKGFQAGVYSSPGYWNELIGTVTWIANYWQWVAHWTYVTTPTLPINWTFDKTKFWQNGIYPAHWWIEEVTGAEGNVDHNYFYGTLEDLKTLLKFEVIPPPNGDCNCEEEIARLHEELNFLKLEIYDLQQKDIDQDDRILELYDLNNTVAGALLVVETDLESVEGALMVQGDLIASLEKDISNIFDAINAINTRLNGIEVEVAEIYNTTANLDIRISDLETTEAEIRAVYNKE